MNWRRWQWTLDRLLRRDETDRELDEEIRAHLAIDIRQRIDAGGAPETARLDAAKDFENIALVKEDTREVWSFTSLERLWQDARYAVRSLRQSFGFTLLALAALALGIGSTTAMFTVLYTVTIRPMPYPEPERLVTVWEQTPSKRPNVVSIFNFKVWKERAKSFDSIAAYNQGPKNLLGGEESAQITGANVTADFFRVLRAEPVLGRGLARNEEDPSTPDSLSSVTVSGNAALVEASASSAAKSPSTARTTRLLAYCRQALGFRTGESTYTLLYGLSMAAAISASLPVCAPASDWTAPALR